MSAYFYLFVASICAVTYWALFIWEMKSDEVQPIESEHIPIVGNLYKYIQYAGYYSYEDPWRREERLKEVTIVIVTDVKEDWVKWRYYSIDGIAIPDKEPKTFSYQRYTTKTIKKFNSMYEPFSDIKE